MASSREAALDPPEPATTGLVVDAHVHIWELGRRPQPWIDPDAMGVLNRDHTLSELLAELSAGSVGGAVLVQVLNDPAETDEYMWSAQSPTIRGVVAWVDLVSPQLADEVDRLGEHESGSRLVGVRHQALAEPDPAGWLLEVAEGRGLGVLARRSLPFDLMFRPEHLDAVIDVTGRHGENAFILDHGGKPPVGQGWESAPARDWAHLTHRLSRLDNVTCKLSGLTTMADVKHWSVADLQPFVDHLLEHFGPRRLMFGSDWPVSRRAGEYDRTVSAVRHLLRGLDPVDQDAVLGGTAAEVYRL